MTEDKKITERLYTLYGTGTGVLFGIPSSLRSSVQTIVKFVLEECKERAIKDLQVKGEVIEK